MNLPPPTGPPIPSKREPWWKRYKAGLLAGAIGVVLVAGMIGSATEDEPKARSATLREPTCEQVRYELDVSPSLAGISITLENGSGNTEQLDVNGSWSRRIGCMEPSDFTYVAGQIDSSGVIECRIYRGSSVVAEAKSSGEYVIASCSD